MKLIGVLGSLNVDLTATVPRFQGPGETITGTGFYTFTGGKGGNQAVASAKLGMPTMMVGKVGADQNGELYRQTMLELGIEQHTVQTVDHVATGAAMIEVDVSGENRIVVVPGANHAVDRKQVDQLMHELLSCDVILMQLEIPMDTVEYAAQKLHAEGKMVILNPAPAQPLSDRLLRACTYVIPNETELHILSGMEMATDNQIKAAAQTLLDKGARSVVVTLGNRGAMLVTPRTSTLVPGFEVRAIDTTGAGDAFAAAFAIALTERKSPVEAIRFANAAAAISTTAMGAQSAMPSREQVQELLNR
ncbi:MAG: ribokinase [Candidatus Limiplasma sp.]|nr:ribokinase [Candidatus Limiplasma sp.]